MRGGKSARLCPLVKKLQNWVNNVKRRAATTGLGSEFDDFLYSSLGEDKHGLLISVASLLGRLNLDPWQEAASYAGLPPEKAAQKLASLIEALPDRPLQEGDPVTLATRLIRLLPHRTESRPPSAATVAVVIEPVNPWRIVRAVLLAFCLGLVAAIEFFR
jgi:hypothetical protein